MRGWERVGRVTRRTWDFDLWLLGSHLIDKGDVLRFSASESGPLRAGSIQVAALLDGGVVTDARTCEAVPSLADDDIVYRATALGEHAFKPSTLAPAD